MPPQCLHGFLRRHFDFLFAAAFASRCFRFSFAAGRFFAREGHALPRFDWLISPPPLHCLFLHAMPITDIIATPLLMLSIFA